GLLTITPEGFTLYCMHVAPGGLLGEPQKLFQTKNLTTSLSFSSNSEFITIITADQPGTLHHSLLAFEVSSGKQLARLSDAQASIEDGKFSPLPGDMRLFANSDRSGAKRPVIWNASTGEREDLAFDELVGEVLAVDWSPDASHLLLCQYAQARQQLYLYDVARKRLTRLQHPHGSFHGEYFSPDGQIYVHLENATTPMQLLLLDGATGAQKQVVFANDACPPSHPWTSITFPSSDGQKVQAWLSVPEGPGPFPTILDMHGGPSAVMTESFYPRGQCWLDLGFAFLSLNYRGSTTFGKAFEEQIRGHIGDWELEDMVAARQWLVDQKIAHPRQVLLTGWSYGGYLTLLGLGRRPDLWAGGMAGVAFGDFVIAYEDEAEMLKAYDRGLMGGTPQEKPEAFHKSSAMTYLEQVRAPLLIIQGRNDTRCPPRSIEVYEQRAKALGKDIEVVWFDTGHGSHDTAERISQQERLLRFAWQIVTTN
ncbi:MAG: S9 family peptidase, partial [Ktedonobacteraceae bacterium]